MTNDIAHLHVHTEYSLLDGACRIKKLVDRVKELGMDSVAITDHGTMHGIVDFYQECIDKGVKPIIGLEAYVVQDVKEHLYVKEQLEINKKELKKKKNTKSPFAMHLYAKRMEEETGVPYLLSLEAQKMEQEETAKPINELYTILGGQKTIKGLFSCLAEKDEKYFGNSIVYMEDIEVENEDGEKETETVIKYKYGISHLLLLARNQTGYLNLLKIASESQLKGFYGKPRVDFDMLQRYGEGIIATSACRGGEIPRMIMRGRTDLAIELAHKYMGIFDEFYLEVQPSENSDQILINEALYQISRDTGIPLVATSDAHYIKKEDSKNHDILLAVSTGASVDDENRLRFDEEINYIMTKEEFLSYGIPEEALRNTSLIADKCNVEIELGKPLLPEIEIPSTYSKRQYIDKLAMEGLMKRYSSWPEEKRAKISLDDYVDRISYELDVIEDKGFIDYFLIVWDVIAYGKRNNIYIGPGRGSAAGCMVSYCLEITNIDPIEYNLLFSRFLNPERSSLPDIDIDIEEYIDIPELFPSGRQKIIEYVTEKYGTDKVCQILAMGTMGTRSVLKDVGRALDIDHNEINRINKDIPMDSNGQWPLTHCLYGDEEHGREPVPSMLAFAKKYPQLIEAALDFEGMPRHHSIHAAGVVISPVDITEVMPLCRGSNEEVVSQLDKHWVEEMGLLKMDFLALKTLGVMHNTVDLIRKRYGRVVDLDTISFEDQNILSYIKNGNTDGIFQIELR